MDAPKLIFGVFQFDRQNEGGRKRTLDICQESGIEELDCGAIYNETILSPLNAPERFVIHGKASPSRNKKNQILEAAENSKIDLKVKKFDGFYLHAPDASTPIEESYEAIQELYESGSFERFGLSNYLPEEVQKIYDYGKSKGYILPSLYQGYYNAVARRCEKDLFPLLRRLNITFYCYSPLGAGWFTMTPESIKEGKEGRFDTRDIEGLVYQAMFIKPSYLGALKSWASLAERSGLATAELAFRWMNFHSALQPERGDGIITSAENPPQLKELLGWRAKGSMERWVVDEIDAIWASCEDEAALDCVNGWFEDIKQGRVIPPKGMGY